MSSSSANPNTTNDKTPATLSHDPISHLHWLEFDGKPDVETRAALKYAGWRWGGYRKAWYSARTVPIIPPCVEAEEAGEVHYAAERADRLEARAQKHDAKATAAYERSNRAVEHIPLGQPILVGHSSERMHRAALRRSHAAMGESVRESKTAERLHYAAQSSRRHQRHAETPEAMTRRAERLEASYRKMARNIAERDAYLQRTNQTDTVPDRQYKQLAEDTKTAAEQLRQKIAAAGGTRADQLNAQVGDLVKIHGFVGWIERVNPKTYTVRLSRDGWTLKLDRTHLTEILIRASDRKQAEGALADEAAAALTAEQPQPAEQPEPEQTEPDRPGSAWKRPGVATCVWCGGPTTDPQHVCQRCRDLDNDLIQYP